MGPLKARVDPECALGDCTEGVKELCCEVGERNPGRVFLGVLCLIYDGLTCAACTLQEED